MNTLTPEQQAEQQAAQIKILAPVAVLGIIAGIIYASATGKSKLGWGVAGWLGPAAVVAIILNLTDYGNPTK